MKQQIKYMKSKALYKASLVLAFIFLTACENFVEIDPPSHEIVREVVFSEDASAISAIVGIYSQMIGEQAFASGHSASISPLTGLSSDELIYHGQSEFNIQMYQNALLPSIFGIDRSFWNPGYKYIFYANSIIEGLENSKLTNATKIQLEGEAKFIRAFCHFYLTNMFGDIPVVTTSDYRVNQTVFRIAQDQVYEQIISDLKDAQNLLKDDYSFSSLERVRPNSFTATALLARVYLYTEDWSNAELEASSIINNDQYELTDLNNVFLANSEEAIWQLKPVLVGLNTWEAQAFVITSAPPSSTDFTLTNDLINAFEPDDERLTNWIDTISDETTTYYYPFKYKVFTYGEPLTEYSMVFRLAEQYLIRAEARTQQGNTTGAQADLNAIRSRAGLPDTEADTQNALLEAIEHERRLELFTEWGHRWFDLKRTGRADIVLGNIAEKDWQATDILYPIPQAERERNPNLTQNPGY